MRPDVDESHNPWSTHSVRTAYENPWIVVEHHEVTNPSGQPGQYGVVRPRNWALGVVPVFGNGDVLLVGQYRYSIGEFSWEIPEGGGAKETDPLESVQRELAEETGYRATDWLKLQTLALSNSVTDEIATIWVAWNLAEGTADPEPTEELTLWRVPLPDVLAMVESGTITDAMTVSGIQSLELRRQRKVLPPGLQAVLG